MAYVKHMELLDRVVVLDYSLDRLDNLSYNCFTFKVLNTLVTFRSAYPLERGQCVRVTNVLEAQKNLVIELMPTDEVSSAVLSITASKIPFESDFKLQIQEIKNLELVYDIVDSDGMNTKVGFLVLLEQGNRGEIGILVEDNYVAKFTLQH